MITILGQLLVNGITIGLIYIILAVGLVLILNVSRIFFIAYGSLFMLGALSVWAGIALLGLPFLISLCMSVLATALIGLASYQFIFRYILYKEKMFLAVIIVAMGLMMILDQTALLVFGPTTKGVQPVVEGIIRFAGVSLPLEKLVIMVLGVIIALILFFFYEKTNIGRAMRAVSFSPEAASLQGINTSMIYLVTLGIAGAMAGFAGGIMAPVYGVYPEMGRDIILSILLVIMLGGMDSMVGAAIGGFVFGITMSFGQYFIGGLAQVLLFVITGIIIFLRPGGLMGSGTELEV